MKNGRIPIKYDSSSIFRISCRGKGKAAAVSLLLLSLFSQKVAFDSEAGRLNDSIRSEQNRPLPGRKAREQDGAPIPARNNPP